MGATDAAMLNEAGKELLAKLSDPHWRLFSGELYKIVIKGDTEEENLAVPFKPNRAQRRFLSRIWHRNIILKARQLGFTTLIAIMWLDFALFNPNVKCGIIAQDDDTAMEIFKDKVKFAYDNLPDVVKEMRPLKYDNAHEMGIKHSDKATSSIRVATSMRGGTYHRLHVSEFGKICAKFPAKAKEVVTGSIPTVPMSGILIIESTAEGQDGAFYKMSQEAKKLMDSGKKLSPKDYRFHFYAWHQDEKYRLDPAGVYISQKDHEYFDEVETKMNITLDMEQRAWYVAERAGFEAAGEDYSMLQEFPSTPDEAFQKSTEGTYYAKQMTAMRKEKRICRIPVLEMLCNTFWDIGGTAGTAIWVLQKVGLEWRAIDYYEAHNETYAHAVRWLNDKGYLYNKHFLPHDAAHKRQLGNVNKSPQEMIEELGLENTVIVPVIDNLDAGINLLKKHFPELYMDEERCAEGIKRLDGYKRKWDSKQGTWLNDPEKNDGNSEGADALRQWAQSLDAGLITTRSNANTKKSKPSNWRTA